VNTLDPDTSPTSDGSVDGDGQPSGDLTFLAVTQVVMPAWSAAVLL
jgi:hypothetical protein